MSPALEFYTSLEWTKDFHFAASGGLTGDTEGLVINNLGTDSESENLATTTGFKPGYYELTLNVANKDAATLNVELIKEEPPIELAVSVNGTPLTAGSESLEGTFTFTKGQSVTV